MQLLRTLAIIALFYYGFKFLRKVLFPFLLRWLFKKANQQPNESTHQRGGRKEGEVHINYTQKTTTKSRGDVGGEYVDFEEIKTNES